MNCHSRCPDIRATMLVLVLSMLAWVAPASRAHASVTVRPPSSWTGTAVNAYVGGTATKHYVCFERLSWTIFIAPLKETYLVTLPSGPSGLLDDVVVELTRFDDKLQFGFSIPDACGIKNLGPVVRNGYFITVRAGDGNDYILQAATTLGLETYGEAGNDILLAFDFAPKLYGGDGDDQLYGKMPGSTSRFETYFGGSGADCIEDESGNMFIAQCGDGTDFTANVPSSVATGCELPAFSPTFVACCPNRFDLGCAW